MEIYWIKDGVKHKHHNGDMITGKHKDMLDVPIDSCDCDLYLKVKVLNNLYVANRFEGDVRRNSTDMYNYVLTKINNEWTMANYCPVKKLCKPKVDMYSKIASVKSGNIFVIPPYMKTNRTFREAALRPNQILAHMYKAFDRYYFTKLFPTQKINYENIWQALKQGENYIVAADKTLGTPWDDHKVLSLQELCIKKLSAHNQVFGGTGNIPNIAYTMQRVEEKFLPAYEKMVKNTHSFFGKGKEIATVTSSVMDIMCQLLDVRRYRRTQAWNYEDELQKALAKIPMQSSSGMRSGKSKKVEIDGIEYRFTVEGKKAYHIEYIIQQIDKIVMDIKNGEKPYLRDRAWTLVPKNEILAGTTQAEIEKFNNKLRLFNIPTMLPAIISIMVHNFRQNVERGQHIAIGISFWNGGAYEMAVKLRYNEEGRWFGTSDIEAYDNNIKAQMLLIYSYFSAYYYDVNRGDSKIFRELLKLSADNLTLKIVHVYKDIWRMIFGGMPSGAYETSHGDSWILMFIYVHFCMYIGLKKPSYMGKIKDYLIRRIIYFYIYGDDFITSIPGDLKDVLDLDIFKNFAAEYYGLTLRDCAYSKLFLSEIDVATGMITKKGVKFLSRYFVRTTAVTTRKDLPPVLPYREFSKTAKKYAYGDGGTRNSIDHVLAAVGMAYDSFGTNRTSYEFCKFMYETNLRMIGCKSWAEYIEKHRDALEGKNVTSMLRKLSITKEVLSEGFPTITRLLDMHRYDKNKHVIREDMFSLEDLLRYN